MSTPFEDDKDIVTDDEALKKTIEMHFKNIEFELDNLKNLYFLVFKRYLKEKDVSKK